MPKLLAAFAVLVAWPALAAGQTVPQETRADRGAVTAPGLLTAPYTSSVGQVRPPGRAADEALERTIGRRTPDEIRDDAIDRSICAGCD
ncbi:hypothetical protein [Salinarimonas soli]|uniref:Uncharacterized protein n=1 Tax=Salinarimonas soli TaxID=1638099 RepID=A0A5B2VEJ5_9HYPH|nr:hypothetical protein [Salinarimonas soli]KAA2236597.1 hypothetical protein F0L46_14085 [Salinarimonas soli]